MDAHLINGKNGAQVWVWSSSFLISSVSSFQFSRPTTVILFGGELDCTGSGEPILFPCVRAFACVCICERERERETVYVCRRDEGEAPGSCVLQLSHRIFVQSCPATAPAQTRALRHDWLIFTSIHNDHARTRLLNITRPLSLFSLSLSLSLSTSPHYPSLSLLTRDYVRQRSRNDKWFNPCNVCRNLGRFQWYWWHKLINKQHSLKAVSFWLSEGNFWGWKGCVLLLSATILAVPPAKHSYQLFQ